MQSQLPVAGYLFCQEKCKWAKNNNDKYTFVERAWSLLNLIFASVCLIFPFSNRGFGGVMGEVLLQVSQGGEGACHGALWAEACNQTGTEPKSEVK